jgi:hypothetical protein
MKIKLDNLGSDDDTVMVTCSGPGALRWAKEEDQSIAGSMWEGADGADGAYAIISDHPDLLEQLEKDGYDDIDTDEYCPPDRDS